MFVLDTNTIIDFFRGKGRVAERLLAMAPRQIGVPAVVAYEVWVGVLGSRNARLRQTQYEQFLATVEIIPFDAETAIEAANIRLVLERRGESIGPLDTLIAATALLRDATLVSRNTKEFGRVRGLDIVNWHD